MTRKKKKKRGEREREREETLKSASKRVGLGGVNGGNKDHGSGWGMARRDGTLPA